MANAIQVMRKAAGYKTADEYAAALGISPSTQRRYERAPEKMPLPAAWRYADDLGTTIDAVVGRIPCDGPSLDALRARLSPENRRLLDDYAEYLASKQRTEDDRAAEEARARYEKLARHYDGLFLERILQDGAEDGLAFASGREYRDRLEQFVRERAMAASGGEGDPDGQQARSEESVKRIMEAYERFHPEAADEEGRYVYGTVRLPV